MSQDDEHLKLLSIFHYVVAGLAFLFSLFPIAHLVLGLLMVTGNLGQSSDGPDTEVIGWLFVGIAAVFMMFGISFAAGLAMAGRYLSLRRRYTFCLVMAALSCLFMPFGTVLGVFTIVVLSREPVKQAFDGAAERHQDTLSPSR